MRLSLEKTVVEFMQSTRIKNDEKMNICNNLVFISWLEQFIKPWVSLRFYP